MLYSFNIAKNVIDEMVNISDQEMINYMLYTFRNIKLLLEPACVAGFAALKKLNSTKFKGQNTLLILCGSNIDCQTWNKMVKN
jgi:Threonine dehydratase